MLLHHLQINVQIMLNNWNTDKFQIWLFSCFHKTAKAENLLP